MEDIVAEFRFRVEDYVILALSTLISAGFGLYVSIIKHRQSSIVEYFLAGKNVPVILVLLSYFSSFAAGGMIGLAMETYTFGAQIAMFIFTAIPITSLFLHYLVVPVFYNLKSISILKYFEIRFGRNVHIMAMVAIIFQMTALGAVNIYVAAVAISQVSALTFWISTGIMTTFCVIYSTLGGMRGIILADAIQAVVMIVAVMFIFVIGIIKSGGPKAIWDINQQHDRLNFFDFRMDPTIRHTFWTSNVGYNFLNMGILVSSQTLLQRCLMAPTLQSAQRISVIGSSMTFVYMSMFQAVGLVIFAFYKGCDIVQSGLIQNVNQIISYFAMENLQQYPGFPGVFFSGVICATLSTISSLLNSISAIIMSNFIHGRSQCTEKLATFLCKVLVIVFGGVMLLGVVVVGNYQNCNEAILTLVSVTSGPMFALYCIGIFCPQANHKNVTVSFSVSLLTGVWMIVGTMVTSSPKDPLPFANCTDIQSANMSTSGMSNVTGELSNWNSDAYFPLSKVSHYYFCLEGFFVTIICFVLLIIPCGPQKGSDDPSAPHMNLDLIPHCIQRLQLKLSRRMRKVFLCDVYGDAVDDTMHQLVKPQSGHA